MYKYLVCILYGCLVPKEARRGLSSPGTGVKIVVSAEWVLGIKPGPFGRAAIDCS